MSVCNTCEKKIGEVLTCDLPLVQLNSGQVMERVRYGDEVCHSWVSELCLSCGVGPGGIHHMGCDCEECPKCHELMIVCGC